MVQVSENCADKETSNSRLVPGGLPLLAYLRDEGPGPPAMVTLSIRIMYVTYLMCYCEGRHPPGLAALLFLTF